LHLAHLSSFLGVSLSKVGFSSVSFAPRTPTTPKFDLPHIKWRCKGVRKAASEGKVTSFFVEGEHCTVIFFNDLLGELVDTVAHVAHATSFLQLSLVELASLADFNSSFISNSLSLLSYFFKCFFVSAIISAIVFICSSICCSCIDALVRATSTGIIIYLESLVCESKIGLFVRICYLLVKFGEDEFASEIACIFKAICTDSLIKVKYLPSCIDGCINESCSSSCVHHEVFHFSRVRCSEIEVCKG